MLHDLYIYIIRGTSFVLRVYGKCVFDTFVYSENLDHPTHLAVRIKIQVLFSISYLMFRLQCSLVREHLYCSRPSLYFSLAVLFWAKALLGCIDEVCVLINFYLYVLELYVLALLGTTTKEVVLT